MARRENLSGPFWLSHDLQRWAKDIVELFLDARKHTAFQVHIDLVNHFRVGMTYQLHGDLLGNTSLRQHADVFVTQLVAAYIGYPVALYIGIRARTARIVWTAPCTEVAISATMAASMRRWQAKSRYYSRNFGA